MREVKGFACGEIFFQRGPYGHNGSVREKAHHDCRTLGSFFNREERLTGHPTVGNSLVVGLAGALADDDVEAIVAEVHTLTGALYTVSYHCDCFILKHFAGFFEGEFVANDNSFFHTSKV